MSGAFDCFDTNRKKLMVGYEKYLEQKKTTKIKEKLEKLLNDIFNNQDILLIKTHKDDLINYQKECFGINIFINKFSEQFLNAVNEMTKRRKTFRSFNEMEEGRNLYVPVYLNSIRKLTDKNKNKMCFASVEDIKGEVISVPIFASYYYALEDELIEGSVYLMNFYKTEDDKIMFGRTDLRNPQEGAIKRMVKLIYD